MRSPKSSSRENNPNRFGGPRRVQGGLDHVLAIYPSKALPPQLGRHVQGHVESRETRGVKGGAVAEIVVPRKLPNRFKGPRRVQGGLNHVLAINQSKALPPRLGRHVRVHVRSRETRGVKGERGCRNRRLKKITKQIRGYS